MLNQESLRKRMKQDELRKQLAAMKEFNSRSKQFLRLLNFGLKTTEDEIKHLMRQSDTLPPGQHSLDIMTVDLGDTTIETNRGKYSTPMRWEDTLPDNDRGIII